METIKKICRWSHFTLILLVLLTACGEQLEPLNVVNTTPDDGAVDVDVNSTVLVEFDQDMSNAALENGDFVVQDSLGQLIEGTISIDGPQLTYNSIASFEPEQTYTVLLSKNLSDGNGRSLDADYTWTFTTAANITSANPAPTPEPPATEPVPENPAPAPDSPAPPDTEPTPEPSAPEPAPEPTPEQPTPVPAPPVPEPPTIPPLEVTSTQPTNGATNVALDAVVSVQFNQDLGNWQMGPDDFYISDSTGIKVLSTIQPSDSGVAIKPAANFSPNEHYTVTIDVGLIAENGAHLTEPYEWSFHTGIEAGIVINSHQSGDVLQGMTQLTGLAAPSIDQVEVSVGYNNYQPAVGTTSWLFDIDSSSIPDGAIPILVRGLNSNGQYTGETELVVFIDNDTSVTTWHPVPIGAVQAPLFAAWGAAADNIYAVGGSVNDSLATILNYNGSQWTVIKDGWNFNLQLSAIWGMSANDFYVAGGGISTEGMILHYQSGQWLVEHRGAFSDVWGTSAADVYVVGSSGVYHFDGDTWSQLEVGYANFHFTAVWGTNAEDVYITGFSGPTDVILHYDGASWTNQLEATEFSNLFLHDIWGAPDDLYAVGTGGRILHYDGINWQAIDTGLNLDPMYSIIGTSPNSIYVVSSVYPGQSKILRFNGANWSEDKVLSGLSLRGIWSDENQGLYAVGSAGVRNVQSTIYYLAEDVSIEPPPTDPTPVEPPPPGDVCPLVVGCDCPPDIICIANL